MEAGNPLVRDLPDRHRVVLPLHADDDQADAAPVVQPCEERRKRRRPTPGGTPPRSPEELIEKAGRLRAVRVVRGMREAPGPAASPRLAAQS